MNYSEADFLPLAISKKLISIKSESPSSMEIVDMACGYLEELGFTCYKIQFGKTANLYAEKGHGNNNLCFAGHFDVVPAGGGWETEPYSATEKDGCLIGRGASDMKCAIACFMAASKNTIIPANGKISLLISGDEEDDPKDGMVSMINWLRENNIKLSSCLIGEPTARVRAGDVVKNGRRGSLTFKLSFIGLQGHVAYPQHAKNPVDTLAKAILALKTRNQKEVAVGAEMEYNLEFVSVDTSSHVSNVIPAKAFALCNIRFSHHYNQEVLLAMMKEELSGVDYEVEVVSYSPAFICQDKFLQDCAEKSILQVTGFMPEMSTEGGTSDGRFLKDITKVIEIGMSNKTAHKANEKVSLDDIEKLAMIYNKFIENYFIEPN